MSIKNLTHGKWRVVALKEILTLLRNGLTVKQNRQKRGYPITRIETISEERINPEKFGYVSEIEEEIIQEYKLEKGDVLFSHINSLEHIGKTAIYEGVPSLLLHGMNLLVLRPDKKKISPLFLLYVLRLLRLRNVFKNISKKAVNQASINQSELQRIKLPLPPLPEQKKIAEILGTVDEAIEKVEQAIERTQRLKRGLMQELLTKGIGHKEFKDTEIGRIPKEWEVVRLGEVGNLQYGVTASATGENTGIKFLRITDIKDEGIDWSSVPYCKLNEGDLRKYGLTPGDVLFARIGATTGKTCFVDRPVKGTFGSYLIRFQPTIKNIDTNFLYFYTQSAIYWLQINMSKGGQLKKGLNSKLLGNIKLPLPPLPEQKKIAEILSAVDQRLELLRKRKERLERVKKGLMEDLLTGKRRVKV